MVVHFLVSLAVVVLYDFMKDPVAFRAVWWTKLRRPRE